MPTVEACARRAGRGFPFRPPRGGAEEEAGARLAGVPQRGKRGTNACVVGHLAVFDGDVEVHSDEDAPVLQVELLDGKFSHKADEKNYNTSRTNSIGRG